MAVTHLHPIDLMHKLQVVDQYQSAVQLLCLGVFQESADKCVPGRSSVTNLFGRAANLGTLDRHVANTSPVVCIDFDGDASLLVAEKNALSK